MLHLVSSHHNQPHKKKTARYSAEPYKFPNHTERRIFPNTNMESNHAHLEESKRFRTDDDNYTPMVTLCVINNTRKFEVTNCTDTQAMSNCLLGFNNIIVKLCVNCELGHERQLERTSTQHCMNNNKQPFSRHRAERKLT